MATKTNLIEKEANVKWVIADQKLIKFLGDDVTYDISDNAAKYLDDIASNTKVSVQIDPTVGDHGTVVFMKIVGAVAKESAPQETKSAPKTDGVELTIAAISTKNKGILFTNEEKKWYSFPESLLDTVKSLSKGDKVAVEIEKKDKGNDFIVSISKVVEEPVGDVTPSATTPLTTNKTEVKIDASNEYDKQENKKKSTYYSVDTQRSIEAQSSINNACEVVSSLVDKNTPPDEVLRMIKKIAEHNHNLLQELKAK